MATKKVFFVAVLHLDPRDRIDDVEAYSFLWGAEPRLDDRIVFHRSVIILDIEARLTFELEPNFVII